MKYKITTINEPKKFVPFRITFEITTYEEYVAFHDKLAIKNTFFDKGNFCGDVYTAGKNKNEFIEISGEINP